MRAERKAQQKREPGEWVYFITDGEAIKVGFAEVVERRMAELQTSHHRDLVLLGCIEGSIPLERHLHRRWRSLRIRGEWFRDDERIRHFIATGKHRPTRPHLTKRERPRDWLGLLQAI